MITLNTPTTAHNTLLAAWQDMPGDLKRSATSAMHEWVAEKDSQSVGIVRMAKNADRWFVTLFIRPELRRQGNGKAVLQQAMRQLSDQEQKPVLLSGDVKRQDIAGIKLFESLGFNCELTCVNNRIIHRFNHTINQKTPRHEMS